MRIGICSFSFHRLLAAGKQDVFDYIKVCKELGCTQLDPWNAHLAMLKEGDSVIHAGSNPDKADLEACEDEYLDRVVETAREVNLPFGCIAVDGAHIYEEDPAAREANRRLAYRWLDVAERLGAEQVRIDAGGPEDMPDEIFRIILDGYADLVARARDKGVEVLTENHWGPTQSPDNVVRLLDAAEGVGLLFDSHNWQRDRQHEGWERCGRYARAAHLKTFSFDENGNEPSVDLGKFIGLLKESGFDGCWGVESMPEDGDEIEGARKTIALIRREVGE